MGIFRKTVGSSLLKTITSVIYGILSVPILLDYFNENEYGVWSIINTIVIYLTTSNLGLNAAASILINKTESPDEKILIFKTSMKLIILVSLSFFIIILFAQSIFPEWIDFLEIPEEIYNESKKAINIMILATVLMLPFSIFTSGINGFYKNHIENRILIFGNILNLLILVFYINSSSSLTDLAIAIICSNLLLNILRIYFYYRIKKSIDFKSKSTTTVNIVSNKSILSLGLQCLLGSIASMLILNTDNILIAYSLELKYVTYYAIIFKLFTILFTFNYIITSSLVPLIGLNYSNKALVRLLYKNATQGIIILGGLFWIGAYLFADNIIILWLGKSLEVNKNIFMVLGAYAYIFSQINLNNVILNTLGIIKLIPIITITEGVLNISVSLLLVDKLGLLGIALGTLTGAVFTSFIAFPLVIKSKTKNLLRYNYKFLIKHLLFNIIPILSIGIIIKSLNISFKYEIAFDVIILLTYLYLSIIRLHPSTSKQIITSFLE